MAEFRLDDLAQLSGVSARNIRAYQERGLVNPPRREGRVAIYDEEHLAQLQFITQLLQKGFALSHIQDFFEGFAKNLDLADILGIQELAKKTGLHQALTAPWGTTKTPPRHTSEGPIRLASDPSSKFARTLTHYGIAQHDGDALVINDPDMAGVLAGFKDQGFGLRVLAGVYEATACAVQQLAEATIDAVSRNLIEHYGEGWIPPAEDQEELAATITDVRELASLAVDRALSKALKDNGMRAVGEYMEGIMTGQGDLTEVNTMVTNNEGS